MLAQEVLLFGLLGAMTSLVISFIVTNGKEPTTALICVFQGAFTGWLSGMMWVYLTSGLEINLLALVLPVFISAFFALILLRYLPRGLEKQVGKGVTILSTIGLFALAFIVAFSSVPLAYKTTLNTETFTANIMDYQPETTTIMKTEPTPTLSIPITITGSKSSITSLMTMAENSSVQSSLDFKIFFTPKAEWIHPYIKIGVYEDKNNDGKLSKGDVLWSDANYKLSTTNTLWRTNCLWQNNVARYGMFSSNGKLLPIFHAKDITRVKDETNVRFLNTPEGFSPQNDMLTWENGVLSEQIINYATISPGETSTIQGEIYCGSNAIGKHIIVVQAYDATLTDPFDDSQKPLQEYILPFTVSQTATDDAAVIGLSPPVILIILGVILLIALIYAKKEGKIR